MNDSSESVGSNLLERTLSSMMADKPISVSLSFSGPSETLEEFANHWFSNEVLSRVARARTPAGRLTRLGIGAAIPGTIEGGSALLDTFMMSLFTKGNGENVFKRGLNSLAAYSDMVVSNDSKLIGGVVEKAVL